MLTPTEEAVWAVIKGFNRAFAANDPDTYFAFIHEDITVITPGNPYRVEGLAPDREEFEFGLREGYTRVGYFQEMQPKIIVLGDTAIVTYFSRGFYGVEGKGRVAYLKETDVLTKQQDAWKIIHIHVSSTAHG